ncbi:MAG: sigma-70 family RNA polymerase sigma factor [Nitrospirae bacterium]|nr:sigma-70 family RNA polymerase sigma factor [Nitrospirota bacterium]
MLKFKNGDTSSFDLLLDRYQEKIIVFAQRMTGDRSEAQDIAQEVFLRVYHAAGKYQPKAKFSTYIFRIARNLCLNRLRERKHRPFSLDCPITTAEGRKKSRDFIDPSPHSSPRAALERKERQILIREAVDSLPPNQKMAVILTRYNDLSYEEASKIMGCSVGAIGLLLHRARGTLRKVLAPHCKG